MTEPVLSYIEAPNVPFEVGSYDGKPILMYGAYRVRLSDGFTCLLPHSGMPGTVGADRLPLKNPHVRQQLIAAAERHREDPRV
jgi:hypothetical protein